MVLEKINKSYGDRLVIDNLSTEIKKGKIVVVMGDSGVGKTTILNIIARTTDFEGVHDFNDSIAYMFHDDRLIPNLNVGENLKLICNDMDVASALKSADLEGCEKLYPIELSAGMSRRVSLIRAMIYPAEILLLDEPFGNLDYSLKYKMMEMLQERHKKTNNTIIMVTHDIDEAVYLADRIIILGDGVIKKEFDKVSKDTRDQILKFFLKK